MDDIAALSAFRVSLDENVLNHVFRILNIAEPSHGLTEKRPLKDVNQRGELMGGLRPSALPIRLRPDR